MYKIIYDIEFIDIFGNRGHTPDYFLGFKTSDPSNDSMNQKLGMGKLSFEMKNPGREVTSIRVVSEGYI